MYEKASVTTKYLLFGAGLFVLGAILLLFIMRDGVYTALLDMRLIPQPEHFTELYLNDLPVQVSTRGGQALAFSFTIHNEEGRDMEYPYAVYVVDATGTTTISSGTTLLADNASAVLPAQVGPIIYGNDASVFVELTGRDQYLHFAASDMPL